MVELIPGYCLRTGSGLDRALLVKFMQSTYREVYLNQDFAHLAQTVDQYFSKETPLWWVEPCSGDATSYPADQPLLGGHPPVACLWMGTAIDQVKGDRHAYIFLLYVAPDHRRRGIGSALMRHAEQQARLNGDRQIGLQVFQANHPALQLYKTLGYAIQSFWMVKPL